MNVQLPDGSQTLNLHYKAKLRSQRSLSIILKAETGLPSLSSLAPVEYGSGLNSGTNDFIVITEIEHSLQQK